MSLTDIKSLTPGELQAEFEDLALPKYRAQQVFQWLQKAVTQFEEMTNLPGELRHTLAQRYRIPTVDIQQKFTSKFDETVKYLFRLEDGELVESVLMRYHHGYSICISTQVGCRMGCDFCATGKGGLIRNLYPSEMLGQIETAAKDQNIRISNVVMMGMGEPLDNDAHVLRFLALVGREEGLSIGMRHISLSTCGIVPKIYALADKKLQLTLSVSLHAPNDEIRRQMMPVARRWSMHDLLTACKYYTDQTGRRISFEYAMISGVNDSDACARELAKRLRGILCHINLILVNPIEETDYQKSSKVRLGSFAAILEAAGFSATVRRTLGADIDASCGQLRRRQREVQQS